MPKSSVVRARELAAQTQNSRCYYCGALMCVDELTAFASRHGLSVSAVRLLQCTAEHLLAKCDGGMDVADNIAAACHFCNSRRHARRKPLSPGAYQKYVQGRVHRRRWHPEPLWRAGLIVAEAGDGASQTPLKTPTQRHP